VTLDPSDTRFLVDSTAARLARWLRFLGYDAVLDRSESDAALLARARREGRVLLTRKRSLGAVSEACSGAPGGAVSGGAVSGGALLLSSDFVSEQLKQVVREFALTQQPLPRCTVCNSELSLVSRADVDGRVPERVYRSKSEFAYCPRCDKYYWKGTHWEHAGKTASEALSRRQDRRQS
jgi:uncharacterized protein with PIN domain